MSEQDHDDPQPAVPSGTGPVAVVLVDTPLAHLDRPFEYSVPDELSQDAVPGARVKVRFAGRSRDGYVVERRDRAEHDGRLAPLQRVISAEPVLTPELLSLSRRVAHYYAGSTVDVLRLAIPPRHARAEKRVTRPRATDVTDVTDVTDIPDAVIGVPGDPPADSAWQAYPAGPAFLRHLAAGRFPAAAWSALPDGGQMGGWPTAIAQAVAATAASGRGSIVVVPDHRDVDRVSAALDEVLGPDRHVRLTADLGPERRYAAWLRVLRGEVHVAIGSRAAAYAPVRDLGLVAWWDDGDDLLAEPRAPYPHTREVLRIRAEASRAALLAGGYARSVDIHQWVREGWMQPVLATPERIRAASPAVTVAGEGHQGQQDAAAAAARVPTVAWRAITEGLTHGPVLVQVPRRGYQMGLACQSCRRPLRCGQCDGPMVVLGPDRPAECQWCATLDRPGQRPCPQCGHHGRRSTTIGHRRTAEELGRAFPGVPVRTSGGATVLSTVDDTPSLVLATPGAEPIAAGGFTAAVLLDGWALLDRAGIDSTAEALRRWVTAAALVRPGLDPAHRSRVVLAGVPASAGILPVEALIRWDPPWLADREWHERRELHLPPSVSSAVLEGDEDAVAEAVALVAEHLGGSATDLLSAPVGGDAQEAARVLITGPYRRGPGSSGHIPRRPTPAEDRDADPAWALIRTPRREHAELVGALRRLRERRSARKATERLRIQVGVASIPG